MARKLEIVVKNSDEDIHRHLEDQRSAPHTCPLCGLKKLMTIEEICEHNSECLTRKPKKWRR